MSPALPLSDDDLHAYADNQLPAERAREVMAALERDPALAVRIADLRRRMRNCGMPLDPWLAEPLATRLITAATASHERLRRGRTGLRRAWPSLAAAATLVIGVASGWMLRGEVLQEQGTPMTFPRAGRADARALCDGPQPAGRNLGQRGRASGALACRSV